MMIGTEFCQVFLSFLSNCKGMDDPLITDLSRFFGQTGKFKGFLGSNQNDRLKDYVGNNLALYFSPLVRSTSVVYHTVHPFNGTKTDQQQISPILKMVLDRILGHKLQDSDFQNLDVDKIQDERPLDVREMLLLLTRYQLIIPGVHSGGNAVYLLLSVGALPANVEKIIKVVKLEYPHFG